MEKYVLLNERNFSKLKNKITNAKKNNKEIIFYSDDDELNKKVLEKENIDIILLNQSGMKDFQKQRNSGFNQVLAKAAKKKNVVVGINLDEIIISNKKGKSKIFGRIKQNITLCNKNKIRMKFLALNEKNQRDIYDLKSLGLVLGMPTWMTKSI